MPECAVKPVELLKGISEPVIFIGEGARVYRDLIVETLKTKAVFAPPSNMSPSAATVAEIAIQDIRNGKTADPVSLVPFYIRKSEAEVNWKG